MTAPLQATGAATTVVREVRAHFATGRTRSLAWREVQLEALATMLIRHEDEWTAALAADLGKSAFESHISEIGLVLSEARLTRRRLRWWLRPRPIAPTLATAPALMWTVREPLGAVLIIGPWNYPLQLILLPVVGALAGGNVAVLKPSELAPATSALVARLVPRYLDRDAVRIVEGGIEQSTALLAQRWDHIFYTGNATVGRVVAHAAAEHLTPTTLELGGKSPAFLDGTGDLRVAASRIVWGKFLNAGQTCTAPDYVLATPSAAAELERLLPQAIARGFGADAAQSPDYGRIVNDRHFERLSAYLRDGRIVCGGTTDAVSRYIEPTVLADVDPESAVMTDEIFGPILPIVVVPDADAAIAFIAAREKPLALYVFTSDAGTRRRFVAETSSGSVSFGLPVAHTAVPGLPFGGVGESGMGAYHGEQSLITFTHAKPVVVKPSWPDTLALVYSPISEVRRRVVRRLL